MKRLLALPAILLLLLIAAGIVAQVNNPSTAGGTNVTANAGSNLNTSALALETGGNLAGIKVKTDNLDVLLSTRLKPADTLAGVTAVGAITNALPPGANLLGYIKQRPNGCTAAGTSDVVHDTVGVATGAGTSVSAATGCVLECYVNNITNNYIPLRLADKSGTPIIWVGGGADFSLGPNASMGCGADGLNISGITFVSGITAIAGSAASLNLHIVTRE